MQKNRLTVGWVQLLLGADEEQIFCQNILFLTTVFFCIYGNYSTEELMFNNVFQSPLLYFSPPIILCAIPCSQHLTLFFFYPGWKPYLLAPDCTHGFLVQYQFINQWLPGQFYVFLSNFLWLPFPRHLLQVFAGKYWSRKYFVNIYAFTFRSFLLCNSNLTSLSISKYFL